MAKDTTENPDELLKDMRFDAHWLNRNWAVVTTDQMLAFVKTAVQFAARFQRMDELCREARLPDAWTADVPTTEGG
jgi:hypothetical protein